MGIYAWLKLLNSTLAAEVPIIASMLLQNASGNRETLPLTILRAPLGPTQVSPRRSHGESMNKRAILLYRGRAAQRSVEHASIITP